MPPRKRRRVPDAVINAARSSKTRVATAVEYQVKLRDRVAQLEKRIAQAKGPEHILECKQWSTEVCRLQKELSGYANTTQSMDSLLEHVKTIEHLDLIIAKAASKDDVYHTNRLLPPSGPTGPAGPGPTGQMSKEAREAWHLKRSKQKRMQLIFGNGPHTATVRKLNQDVCAKCGVDRHVNREMAVSMCPSCGTTYPFASHIFDSKDVDGDEFEAARQQNLAHMQKYMAQFERGFPMVPDAAKRRLAKEYSVIHVLDAAKVNNARTIQMMKRLPPELLSKEHRSAPDRVSKELRGEPIPEFTSSEISKIVNQRAAMHPTDADEMAFTKKSFRNDVYARYLGRANGCEPARLVCNSKQSVASVDRIREFEQVCEYQKAKHGDRPDQVWSLYPST